MKYVTAGESHGQALVTIITDVPAGIRLSSANIDSDLARRQRGYGRGGRMKIETDKANILSGVRFGKTLGTPIALQIINRDWENWTKVMAVEGEPPEDLIREQNPRPGHADLVGAMKIGSRDCRDILERASARETAARVAAGAVAKAYLAAYGVSVGSYVTRIGDVKMPDAALEGMAGVFESKDVEESPVRCPDVTTSENMAAAIDSARENGESLGGWFTVTATGLVPGIGGYAEASERLTSRIGAAILSIPAIKGVEFGLGFTSGTLPGSQVHDAIIPPQIDGESRFEEFDKSNVIRYSAINAHIRRATNNAGGLEGGMTNGEPLIVNAVMKPIPTLTKPLKTINLRTHEPVDASKERSDVCAVPAAAVVAEAEVAMVLANAYMDKFGRDDMTSAVWAFRTYYESVRAY